MDLWPRKANDYESGPQETKAEKCKKPWLLLPIDNGLKAVNGTPMPRRGFIPNKKFPVLYFEYDKITGRNAADKIVRISEIIDKFKEITPNTEYFIYSTNKCYLRNDGVLVVNKEKGRELFYSDETIRNQSAESYFNLIEPNEANHGREEVQPESAPRKSIEDQREL